MGFGKSTAFGVMVSQYLYLSLPSMIEKDAIPFYSMFSVLNSILSDLGYCRLQILRLKSGASLKGPVSTLEIYPANSQLRLKVLTSAKKKGCHARKALVVTGGGR